MTMEQVLALSGSKEPLKMTYEFAFLFSSIVVSASPRIRSESTPIFSPPSCPVLLLFSLFAHSQRSAPSSTTSSSVPRSPPSLPSRFSAMLSTSPKDSRPKSRGEPNPRSQRAVDQGRSSPNSTTPRCSPRSPPSQTRPCSPPLPRFHFF